MLEAERRGPALKNRLVGDVELYRGLLDREHLKTADGVKYFRDKLRPHFMKGTQSVFLWKFCQFNRARWGHIEMVKWIGKFSLLLKRLKDSWAKSKDKTSILPTWLRRMLTDNQEEWNFWIRTHKRLERDGMLHRWPTTKGFFPFSVNLTTLMFIVASDLSEAQGERFTSSLSLRGIMSPLTLLNL